MANPALASAFEPRPVGSGALAQRLLNFILFVTVLLSCIAFIEPSPHDAMMFVLLIACVWAHVRMDRKLAPLIALLVLWLIGGAIALINVADDQLAVQYFGTSVYLVIAAIIFACLFCEGDLTRLSLMNRAYLTAALIATAAGYAGYFHLFPGANIFLGDTSGELARISSTFKDPNVFGPFLIFPLMMLMLGFLSRPTMTSAGLIVVLAGGVLLSYSRGAWIHFGVSAAVAVSLAYLSAPDKRVRTRIVALTGVAVAGLAILFVGLISIDSIREMLIERAKVIQPYDVGSGGRFTLQQLALSVILENPAGLGPLAFSNLYGSQQHNVYLQGFLVYGWIGGAAYLTLVVVTLLLGLRHVLQRTPWQTYLIAAYAAFVGEVGEGSIIDTDHWRHFFLLLGLVWGLSAANINYCRGYANRRTAAICAC